MPIVLNNVEYLTTAEAMTLTDMKSRETWRKYARQYGFKHHAQVGKSKRYLWRKSDVEKLLAPL